MKITPITHTTLALFMSEQVIYVDPIGGTDAFAKLPVPTIILVTDIHSDHFDSETLKDVAKDETVIIAPQAVKDQMPNDALLNVVVLNNGEKTTQNGVEI